MSQSNKITLIMTIIGHHSFWIINYFYSNWSVFPNYFLPLSHFLSSQPKISEVFKIIILLIRLRQHEIDLMVRGVFHQSGKSKMGFCACVDWIDVNNIQVCKIIFWLLESNAEWPAQPEQLQQFLQAAQVKQIGIDDFVGNRPRTEI